MSLKESFLSQIDAVLDLHDALCQSARPYTYDDSDSYQVQGLNFSGVNYEDVSIFYSASVALVERVVGLDSVYGKQILPFINDKHVYQGTADIPRMAGILKALRKDIEADSLKSASELIHGELFGDFLEMADFLLDEGYKDAAAVIGGGVLETHLRQLCIKHNIDTEHEVRGQIQAKRADQLNSELVGNGVYSKLDQKNVTAWLDLRNKAAHASYQEYSKDQVSLLLQGIRYFITRYPA